MICQDFFAKSYIFPRRYLARTSSKGTRPFSLFGTPCPRLLYPYCITTWEICQEVFEISFKGLFLLGAPLTLGVLWTPLDFSYIVSHIGRFVKGSLRITETFFRVGYIPTCGGIASAPWHYWLYYTCPQIAIGKIHKIGIFISPNFVQLFAWQIAGGVL